MQTEQIEMVLCPIMLTATALREVFVMSRVGMPPFTMMVTPPDSQLACSRSFRKTFDPLGKFVFFGSDYFSADRM